MPDPLTREGLTQRELLDLFDRCAPYPGIRAAIRDILLPVAARQSRPEPASLDVVWAALEAAIPEEGQRNMSWGLSRRVGENRYYAWADDFGEPGQQQVFAVEATAKTPIAALQNLTRRLSEKVARLTEPSKESTGSET